MLLIGSQVSRSPSLGPWVLTELARHERQLAEPSHHLDAGGHPEEIGALEEQAHASKCAKAPERLPVGRGHG